LNEPSAIERALELARSGTVRSVEEIRRTLKKEGRDGVDAHLAGDAFRKQLKAAIDERIGKRSG
jgi:hypothetical protein